MRGNLEISELYSKGAKINGSDLKGDQYTILMHALANGHEKLAKWLIAKNGADVNDINNYELQMTPLHLAAGIIIF